MEVTGEGRRGWGPPSWESHLAALRHALQLVQPWAGVALKWAWPKDALCWLFLLGCTLVFFQDALLKGRVFYENDTAVFYYPLTSRIDAVLGRGELPLWSPYIFAGYPLFADGEGGMLYPITVLLLFLLPAGEGFLWSQVGRFFLASLFMYIFARSLEISRPGALISALVFAYGNFLVAQIQHSNLGNSAIWLPLILFFIEKAVRSQGSRRQLNLLFAGLTFGLQLLAVHIQPVLISILAIGLYTPFRVLFGPVSFGQASRSVAAATSQLAVGGGSGMPMRLLSCGRLHMKRLGWQLRLGAAALGRRLALLLWALGLVGAVGAGLAAIQLLPLYELSRFSLRGTSMSYEYATTYSLGPLDLVQLIFPYFFRLQSGEWWSLWSGWEQSLYVGIAPLVLAGIGFAFIRNRYTFCFSFLAVLSLLLALGNTSPVKLYWYLWQVPGYSYLRAPVRFSYLFVFAMAVLAGLGAHWLSSRLSQKRGEAAPGNGEPSGKGGGAFVLYLVLWNLLLFGLVWAMVAFRQWWGANREEALGLIQKTYLSLRRGNAALTTSGVYDGLLRSLDITNDRTLFSLAFLLLTLLLLLIWYQHRRASHLWQGLLVLLVAGDLLLFAQGFHPSIPLERLSNPVGAVRFLIDNNGLHRVYTKHSVKQTEPNKLLAYRVSELGGYSSLPPQRHREYFAYMREADSLMDLAGVRYIVEASEYTPLPSFEGVSFDPRLALVKGPRGNPNATAVFPVSVEGAEALGVVSALESAEEVPQGAPVAEVELVGPSGERRTLQLRAGVDLSEWAYERPDVRPLVKHDKARSIFKTWQVDWEGRRYETELYYTQLPIEPFMAVRRVEVRYIYPKGSIQIYGLGLRESGKGELYQVRQKDNRKKVYEFAEARVYENTSYMPRAFLVSSAIVTKPRPAILDLLAWGKLNPRSTVVLEEPFNLPLPDEGLQEAPEAPPSRAEVVTYASDRVVVETESGGSAFLVLTDSYYPGWRAYVDGREEKIYRADYLFRAVYLPGGRHRVEFLFQPLSMGLGALITLGTVAILVLFASLLLLSPLWKGRRLGRGA